MAWSPEQIARRLPFDFPADDSMRISHEAIYRPFTCKAEAHCGAS
jgi:IS30 family transposase